jgi:hypothetical protein
MVVDMKMAHSSLGQVLRKGNVVHIPLVKPHTVPRPDPLLPHLEHLLDIAPSRKDSPIPWRQAARELGRHIRGALSRITVPRRIYEELIR